ncbi:nose resistant to fluoxetine protein 6-like [Amblyomma americanum]
MSVQKVVLIVVTVLLCGCLPCCLGGSGSDGDSSASMTEQQNVSYVSKLKEWIASAMNRASPSLTRKLLEAEVSADCSVGLLTLVRGVRNLEPWALRLIDATAKYPSGALATTRVDLGAFDECVQTVVRNEYGHETARAQYCNVVAYGGNKTDLDDLIAAAMSITHPRVAKFRGHIYEQRIPIMRLGICVLDVCNQDELQLMAKAVLPKVLDVTITDCVTALAPDMTRTQVIILAFLGTLVLLIVLGTAVDVYCSRRKQKGENKGVLLSVLTSFSVVSNTRMMLQITTNKSSDAYSMRFLHGIRFFSIVYILVGHSYGAPSDIWANMVNAIVYADNWANIFTTVGYMSVDCFFFLNGFLLAFVVHRQKRNGVIVFVIAVVRRFIRTMVPVFFCLMCLFLLPLITSGPDAKAYFRKLNDEFQRQWLYLLLQVQNYDFEVTVDTPIFGHLWYLSLDFQFFLVSLPILLLLKSRPRIAAAAFVLLSFVGCSVATWQVAGNEMTPFIVPLTESITTFLRTGFHYYFYPFYHAVCYFVGCMTYFFVGIFKEKKISKACQFAAWLFAIACGLFCIFIKVPWYQVKDPTTEFGKLSLAFFDRILWSILMSWVTIACATGRGGFLNTFLSWSFFTPLSRLAFGVYIIHVPFVQLWLHISRERLFFSHFFVMSFFFTILVWSFLLSYLLFIICEAPTGKLEKLIFEPLRRRMSKEAIGVLPHADGAEHKLPRVAPTRRAEKVASLENSDDKKTSNGWHYEKGNLTTCHL